MRLLTTFGIAGAVLALATAAGAGELKSGPQVGDSVGAFNVVKCGGVDDDVDVGEQLCYV